MRCGSYFSQIGKRTEHPNTSKTKARSCREVPDFFDTSLTSPHAGNACVGLKTRSWLRCARAAGRRGRCPPSCRDPSGLGHLPPALLGALPTRGIGARAGRSPRSWAPERRAATPFDTFPPLGWSNYLTCKVSSSLPDSPGIISVAELAPFRKGIQETPDLGNPSCSLLRRTQTRSLPAFRADPYPSRAPSLPLRMSPPGPRGSPPAGLALERPHLFSPPLGPRGMIRRSDRGAIGL